MVWILWSQCNGTGAAELVQLRWRGGVGVVMQVQLRGYGPQSLPLPLPLPLLLLFPLPFFMFYLIWCKYSGAIALVQLHSYYCIGAVVSELLALEQSRSAIALTLQALVQWLGMLWCQCNGADAVVLALL
jgi:hypothetical protein